MGYTSLTQYVVTGAKPAAESYHPCHKFGDPDVFGIGIRVAFYILYATAVLVLLLSRPDALRPVRLSLSAIAFAVFINLCCNATSEKTLVIIDWWIGISYVFWTFLLLLVPRTVVRKFGKGKHHQPTEHHHHDDQGYRYGQRQQGYGHHQSEKPATKKSQLTRKFHKTDLSIASCLLVWSMFVLVTPWLYWKGIGYNSKKQDFGCDVKVLFIFVPISVYNSKFVTALKVFSVISVLTAVVCVLIAVMVAAVNLIRIFIRRNGDMPVARSGAKERLAHFIWAVVVLIAFGLTLASVEVTISVNKVHVDHKYVASTGQLLSLILAIGTFFYVLAMIIGKKTMGTGQNEEEECEEPEVTSHHSHSTRSGGPLVDGDGNRCVP